MMFTITGIGFLIKFLGLSFCGLRFFEAFKKTGGTRSGSRSGILLTIHFLGIGLVNGILAVGSLFFAKNPEVLYLFLIIANSFLVCIGVVSAYLFLYILFPSVSPKPAVIGTLTFGILLMISTIIVHPLPAVNLDGWIDWSMPSWLDVMLFYFISLNIGVPLIIFWNAFLRVKYPEVKVVSFIVVASAMMGIVGNFIRFLLSGVAASHPLTFIFDVGIGLTLIVVFLPPPTMISMILKVKTYLGSTEK